MMAHPVTVGMTLVVVFALHGQVLTQESPEAAARAALDE